MYVGEYAPRVLMLDVPNGLAGTRTTVAHIRRLILEGSRSLMVRRVAEDALSRVNAKDYRGELRAIHDWVDSHVRFTRDPEGTERLQSADETLRHVFTRGHAFLDCDDYSVLLGSLLKTVGFPVRIETVGTRGFPHHVYVSTKAGGRWYAIDPTTKRHPSWGFREVTSV